MKCEEVQDLLIDYFAGEFEGDETALHAHVQTCETCAAEYKELAQFFGTLSAETQREREAIPPPPSGFDRVHARVHRSLWFYFFWRRLSARMESLWFRLSNAIGRLRPKRASRKEKRRTPILLWIGVGSLVIHAFLLFCLHLHGDFPLMHVKPDRPNTEHIQVEIIRGHQSPPNLSTAPQVKMTQKPVLKPPALQPEKGPETQVQLPEPSITQEPQTVINPVEPQPNQGLEPRGLTSSIRPVHLTQASVDTPSPIEIGLSPVPIQRNRREYEELAGRLELSPDRVEIMRLNVTNYASEAVNTRLGDIVAVTESKRRPFLAYLQETPGTTPTYRRPDRQQEIHIPAQQQTALRFPFLVEPTKQESFERTVKFYVYFEHEPIEGVHHSISISHRVTAPSTPPLAAVGEDVDVGAVNPPTTPLTIDGSWARLVQELQNRGTDESLPPWIGAAQAIEGGFDYQTTMRFLDQIASNRAGLVRTTVWLEADRMLMLPTTDRLYVATDTGDVRGIPRDVSDVLQFVVSTANSRGINAVDMVQVLKSYVPIDSTGGFRIDYGGIHLTANRYQDGYEITAEDDPRWQEPLYYGTAPPEYAFPLKTEAKLLTAIEPTYPDIGGVTSCEVVLRLWVETDGTTSDIQVHQVTPKMSALKRSAFVDAAVKAAETARFAPATQNGEPIRMRIQLPIEFDVR
jgi:TonB family protein